MDVGLLYTHYGASYHTPCPSLLIARFTTPGEATSTTSKRTLRDCETAKACRTSDQRPTGRVVALPSAMAPKQLHIFQPDLINACNDHQIMQSTSNGQKRKPCWLPVRREGWGANAHDPRRWMSWLHVGHVEPGSSIAFLKRVP